MFFVCLIALASGFANACTITLVTPSYAFGEHAIGSTPASTEMTVSVGVNCAAGVPYSLYPYSGSANSAVALAMTNSGSPNGQNYMLWRRTNGTLFTKANTASHITGTGTGTMQEYQVKVFLSGGTAPSNVLKIGTFSTNFIAFQVKNTSNNATYDSASVNYSGIITAACSISASGNLDFGDMPTPASNTTYERQTSLTVNCTTGTGYQLYADNPNTSNAWSLNALRPVSNQYSQIQIEFHVRPSGGSYQMFSNGIPRSFTATGSNQSYDMKAILLLLAGAKGSWSTVVQPTIRF